MKSLKLMALDVGTKRLVLLLLIRQFKIAIPLITIDNDETQESAIKQIIQLISKEKLIYL